MTRPILSVTELTSVNLQYLGIMQMEMVLSTSQGQEIVPQQPEVVALQLPELLLHFLGAVETLWEGEHAANRLLQPSSLRFAK